MNNTVQNQIYPKKSQYISLSWLFEIIVRNYSLTVSKTRIATIIGHEKGTDTKNNEYLQEFSIIAYYWRLEFWIWIRMVYLKYQIQIQMEIWNRNLDETIFELK